MNPAMPPEQAVILLRFLFARTRSTVGQPAPVLRWLYDCMSLQTPYVVILTEVMVSSWMVWTMTRSYPDWET